MARQESDREDLLRDATALRKRAEFRVPGEVETVIAGFRKDGSLSIYFGPDPCFHFDCENRLRRAFVEGDLYRSEGTHLSRLTRVRTAAAVELRRRDLTMDETAELLEQISDRIQRFDNALQQEQAVCLQVVPDGTEWKRQLTAVFADMLRDALKLSPAIRKRR